MVGQFPLGGVAWDYFHYVLGLHALGHDVYFHEDTWTWPHDPAGGGQPEGAEYTIKFLRDFFRQHAPALNSNWHYVLMHDRSYGMNRQQFDQVARTADIFLNISGACFIPDNLNPRCIKVWMDTDPGYNHIRLSERPAWAPNLERWINQVRAHDVHLTYAENIWADDCLLPRLDIDWIPTRPIATLPEWRFIREMKVPTNAPFTTVMGWDYFPGPLVYKGVEYHGKPAEYARFHDLPKRAKDIPLMLAVGGHATPVEDVRRDGWELVDGRQATLTPQSYQDFIAHSAGEWSIAKNVFVGMKTGWFSCRTCCYLASGRPAVVQDTGWSKYVPSGNGVIAFTTPEEAIAGLREVRAHYDRHCQAAYDVAEQYLSPKAVLAPMLDAIIAKRPA